MAGEIFLSENDMMSDRHNSFSFDDFIFNFADISAATVGIMEMFPVINLNTECIFSIFCTRRILYSSVK